MNDYDFIVIGAGSAGSMVTYRLSENPNAKVLVIEAGGTEIPENMSNPSVWYTLLGSPYDWGYSSVPQTGLNGRQTYEPRGKVIGGTSQLYIMMHIRGHKSDFDNWAYNGAVGWSYDEVLPYFKRVENQEDHTSDLVGTEGPLSVINAGAHNPNPYSKMFLDACQELGYPSTTDFNGPQMEGYGWHHVNIGRDGKRASMAVSALLPALERPNVTLSPNSQVTRLLFEGQRCVGVEYVQNGETKTARCSKEVILSAGALESPHILLNSGIGPEAQLKEFGKPVVVDLPGVGENFHNHVLTGVIMETRDPVPPGNLNLSEAALFTKSDSRLLGPDLQFNLVHVPFDIIIGQAHPNAITIIPGLQRPLSRGWVRLGSSDPLEKPLVNPNYLSEESDAHKMVKAIKISREIFAASPFKDCLTEELLPGPEYQTDDELMEFARKRCDSYHHQCGSCKMGIDSLAVVDPELRVYGVEGLRVADASVMPAVVTGNPHTAIVMIGERAADFIKKQYAL